MKGERLYWAIARPWRGFGLTVDEWVVLLLGVIPGILILSSGSILGGLFFLIIGTIGCWGVKKFKKITENFLFKSYLNSKGYWPVQAKYFPKEQIWGK